MRGPIKALTHTALTVTVAAFLAGSVPLAGATVSSGDRAIYVPITPCRLFDTRPAPSNIGLRSTPIGAGDTFTLQVRGANGDCNIPAGAVAVAVNTTVVNGSAASFLTVFPAGAPRPLAASLNWVAGQPPTPNQLIVALAADGQISLYNFAGTVDVVGDIVGYYEGHDFDDRYYTKAQIDSGYYTKAQIDARTTTRSITLPIEALNSAIAENVGLNWQYALGAFAEFVIHRPPDYVPATAVTLKILFTPTTPATADPTVQFFARPRDYDPGDSFLDVVGTASNLVTVTGNAFAEATIVFAANALPKQWWYIVIQRNTGMANAYASDVKVYSVELSYTGYVNPPG